MPEPLTVTISHTLGRDEAKRRIEGGLERIRTQLAPYITKLEVAWDSYRLDFRVAAMRQTVSGRIDVEDDTVRIEIALPFLLQVVANRLIARVEREGSLLLGKPKAGV
jgi:hypothetical protein